MRLPPQFFLKKNALTAVLVISLMTLPAIRAEAVQQSYEITLPRFGDANNDGEINLTDPLQILFYLFHGWAKPACSGCADVDDNEAIDIADAINILHYLFKPDPSVPAKIGELSTRLSD